MSKLDRIPAISAGNRREISETGRPGMSMEKPGGNDLSYSIQ